MKKLIYLFFITFFLTTSWPEKPLIMAADVDPFATESSAVDEWERPYQTLPADFPQIDVLTEASGTDEGYIFVTNFNWLDTPNTVPYLMILDNNGEPVFAHKLSTRAIDFKPQPGGRLSYFDQELGYYVILDETYTQVDTIAAGNGYETDVHELILTEDGHAILMIYDSQPMDMSQIVPGGDPNATVIGLVLQELDENDNVIFEWHSWDHFEITDSTMDITGPVVDYAHGNALDVDTDGNWLVSSRHMDEVTKINRQTGEIIWRLGGKNNQFTFVNEADKFFRQHDVRRLGNGNLILFDNGEPAIRATSRAVEYALDEVNMTAMAVNIFTNTPETFSLAMGAARRLPNGNTLVGWGSGYPALTEFRPDGSKAFELAFDAPLVSYRAYRAPWVGAPITSPVLLADSTSGEIHLTMSWNGATEVTSYEIYGGTTPNPTSLLTTVSRQGFETSVTLPTADDLHYFRVMPLDQTSNPTVFSNEVSADAYQVFMPFLTFDEAKFAIPAAATPAAYAWPANGTDHVFYRGLYGQIHELWRGYDGTWRQNHIGQLTEAPLAIGAPSAYVWAANQTQHVVYRSEDGQIHELWYRADLGWQYNNLSQVAGAPVAASDPIAYVWVEDVTQHVVYRGTDNHIYELWKGLLGWQFKDLTKETNAALATGTPQAYVWVGDKSQHVIYRGEDGQIHELWFKRPSGWNRKAIGAEAGGVPALGDPFGLARNEAGQQHVFYRGTDGRIHELWWSAGAWKYRFLGIEHVVVGSLSGVVETDGKAYSVFYRKTDGHLYRLRFDGDGNWVTEFVSYGDFDITAKSSPVAFLAANGMPEVIYRGDEGQLYHRFLDASQTWQREEISLLSYPE